MGLVLARTIKTSSTNFCFDTTPRDGTAKCIDTINRMSCSKCESYKRAGRNYCRVCGARVNPHANHVRIAAAYSTDERYCGYWGQAREKCNCWVNVDDSMPRPRCPKGSKNKPKAKPAEKVALQGI